LQDRRQHMREMSLPRSAEQPAPLVSAALAAAAEVDGSKLTPVVFLHGMGDASSNPGMQSMCRTASDMYPGLYVVCANVADGLASITTPIAEQVDELADLVKADARLAGGFHAVGLSQGGLVLRGYVERYNEPPVRRLISVCSPHAGISSCPSSSLYKMVCPLWKLAPYTARLSFADYWKDPSDQATYLERSRWLADFNNERENQNADYKRRMATLDRYVLVEAVNDTTVAPHVSESHGFYAWGSNAQILALRETSGYKQDAIGVRTLDESGRLVQLQYQGDHLQFSDEFWSKVVLPHLGP